MSDNPCMQGDGHVSHDFIGDNCIRCGKSASATLLGPKHKGMKVSVEGFLGRIRDGWRVESGDRYVIGELLKHLEEVGERYYKGDIKAVDEFLQLYCLDKGRP